MIPFVAVPSVQLRDSHPASLVTRIINNTRLTVFINGFICTTYAA